MHNEIRSFLARMKLMCGQAFNVERVLECGSYDINGSPRPFFSSAKEYVGVDWRPGPGVDEVSLIHDYKGRPDGHFQFVVSTSLLEHDPFWRQSIQRMLDLLAPGGSLLITCAGPGFHEHEKETSPAHHTDIPGAPLRPAGEYYWNLSVYTVVSVLTWANRFERIAIEDDPTVHDVRVFAIGKMPTNAGVPADCDAFRGVPTEVLPC